MTLEHWLHGPGPGKEKIVGEGGKEGKEWLDVNLIQMSFECHAMKRSI